MARLFRLFLAAAVLGAVGFWVLTMPRPLQESALPDHRPDPANGEVMFWVGGCASCHAAPGAEGDDRVRLAGGMEFATPFGTFRAPNVSPDPRAGIGDWSTIEFVNAMTRGISPDGRHYYPAFPYPNYQRMSLEDVIDLKAYLDTLPVEANTVADHDLAFPFNIRRGLGMWKLRYLDGHRFEADPSRPAEIERGRYLVQGPGHCGACHTPRDRFGGEIPSRFLAGAASLEPGEDGEAEWVPNITSHEDALGGWSRADIADSFASGFTPEFDSFGSTMAEVQTNLSHLPAADLDAIAAYLLSVPPIAPDGP